MLPLLMNCFQFSSTEEFTLEYRVIRTRYNSKKYTSFCNLFYLWSDSSTIFDTAKDQRLGKVSSDFNIWNLLKVFSGYTNEIKGKYCRKRREGGEFDSRWIFNHELVKKPSRLVSPSSIQPGLILDLCSLVSSPSIQSASSSICLASLFLHLLRPG
jgi:hypothetical protein